MQGISPKQIKKIHALANRLGWSDEEYRKYLMRQSKGFVTSCKDLSEAEAEKIIKQMELLAAAKGVWEVRLTPPDPLLNKRGELSGGSLNKRGEPHNPLTPFDKGELSGGSLNKRGEPHNPLTPFDKGELSGGSLNKRGDKYEELAGREGMATPKQLRMIEAMWKDVSRTKTETERAKTLRNFIYRRWGVSDIRWLEKWQVRKVVKALKEMRI